MLTTHAAYSDSAALPLTWDMWSVITNHIHSPCWPTHAFTYAYPLTPTHMLTHSHTHTHHNTRKHAQLHMQACTCAYTHNRVLKGTSCWKQFIFYTDPSSCAVIWTNLRSTPVVKTTAARFPSRTYTHTHTHTCTHTCTNTHTHAHTHTHTHTHTHM